MNIVGIRTFLSLLPIVKNSKIVEDLLGSKESIQFVTNSLHSLRI